MVIRTSLRPLGKSADDGIPIIERNPSSVPYAVRGVGSHNIDEVINKVCVTPMINWGLSPFPPTSDGVRLRYYIGNWMAGASAVENSPHSNIYNNNIGNLTFERYGSDGHGCIWPNIVEWYDTQMVKVVYNNVASSSRRAQSSYVLDPHEGYATVIAVPSNLTSAGTLSYNQLGLANYVGYEASTWKELASAKAVSVDFPLVQITEQGPADSYGTRASSMYGAMFTLDANSSSATRKKVQKQPIANTLTTNFVNTSVATVKSSPMEMHATWSYLATSDYSKMAVIKITYPSCETSVVAPDTTSLNSNGKPTNFGGFTCNNIDWDTKEVLNSNFNFKMVGNVVRNISSYFHYETEVISYKTPFAVKREYDSNLGYGYKLMYMRAQRPNATDGAIWVACKFAGWTNRLKFKKDIWTAKLSPNGRYLVIQFVDSSIALIDGSDSTVRYFRLKYGVADKMTNNDSIIGNNATNKTFPLLIGVYDVAIVTALGNGNSTVDWHLFPKLHLEPTSSGTGYTVPRHETRISEIKSEINPNPNLIMYGS